MSAIRDLDRESRILAQLPPDDAAFLADRLERAATVPPTRAELTERLDDRDEFIRATAARFYGDKSKSGQADAMAGDLGRATEVQRRDGFDPKHLAVRRILDGRGGSPLSARQILNILNGVRTPS